MPVAPVIVTAIGELVPVANTILVKASTTLNEPLVLASVKLTLKVASVPLHTGMSLAALEMSQVGEQLGNKTVSTLLTHKASLSSSILISIVPPVAPATVTLIGEAVPVANAVLFRLS